MTAKILAALVALMGFSACAGSLPVEEIHESPTRTPLTREQRLAELVTAGPHVCGRTLAGKVACWGVDIELESDPSCSSVPGQRCPISTKAMGISQPRWVEGLDDAKRIAIGGYGAAIRDTGEVVVWSLHQQAPLMARQIPELSNVVELALGILQGCAATSDGVLWCWGRRHRNMDDEGFLRILPHEVEGGLLDMDTDSTVDRFCFLSETGYITCSYQDGGTLTPIPDALEVVTSHEMTCALRRGKAVTCWSDNGPEALEPLTGTEQVALAGGRACALGEDGRVTCWGQDLWELVDLGLTEVSQIGLSRRSGCARQRSGRVVCWDASDPIGSQRVLPGIGDAVSIVVGQMSCVLQSGGFVSCWGEGIGPTPRDITISPDNSRSR